MNEDSRTYFKLSQDVNEDATVKHGLTVDGRDEVLDLLEGQGSDLLHNLTGKMIINSLNSFLFSSKQGFGSGSACFCPARIRINLRIRIRAKGKEMNE